ncbi:MAG: hypothetical protein GXP54_06040 [Deltaproteobacteria bacterium]|nr:hypothetical protein [Deltaproteobacteria bacterium]
MRMRFTLFLALSIGIAAPLAARPADVFPVVYRATKVNQAGTSVMVVLPEPFEGFEPSRINDSLLRAFDALKDAHPYEYGNATLLLNGVQSGARRATLNLDPERSDYWDLVASEVYYTLRGLGAAEVRAPAIRATPLDASSLRLPVARLTVPYYDALPPHRYANVLVAVSPLEVMPADLFYLKLQRADRGLIEKVLGGLVRGGEAARLAVLAAFPHLRVDRRASRLMPLLDDPSPGVRLAVLKLLENEKGSEVNNRLSRVVETDDDPSVKLAAVHILSSRGIRRYDVFIEMGKLGDPSDQVVIGAIERLVSSRNPVVATALNRSLRHKSAAVREAARKGLISLGAGAVMVKALHDDRVDAQTRGILARHLASSKIASERTEGLSYLIKSGDAAQAVWAAGVLGDTRPGDGLGLLYQALLRNEPEVRSAAVKAIGAYHNPVSLKPLLGSIHDDREKALVEQVAVEVIAAQNLDTILALMEGRDVTIRRLAMKALGDALKGALPPPRAISVLKARLGDKDLDVRRAAVYALARVSDPKVATSIMKLSGDPDDEIRAAAVVAAAGSNDPAAAGILVKALSDPSDKVKSAALDGVAAKGIQAARASLKMLGQHRNVEVRRKAVTTYLGLLKPGEAAGELDFLTRLLWDRDPDVKLAAIGAVKQVHERRAIIAISGLVIDPSRKVKEAAIKALAGTHEKDALEGIEKAVFDDDGSIRMLALDALATLGRSEALDFLSEVIRMEKDPQVKARAEATRKILMER